MTYDLFLGLVAFAFVSSVTPGPNNLMIMASGANFGVVRSVPHALGISLGFGVMIVLVGLGLAQIFVRWPVAKTALAVVSVVYLLWLAWKIANAAPPDRRTAEGQPMTFGQAAAFQWVNPKAWTMALTAVTLYTAGGPWAVVPVATVFTVVNLPSISLWLVMGVQMRRFLTSPGRLRAFNWTMAALLVASLWPSLAPLL
ncbi:LysE family translocator [Jannaschia pohangensis]|uniref:Threonine/homoserine/homoserine lactone efflux protein n=1 Tax=Jannaschia pohangensis TaxID=390807 RepID=A0A1I3MS46_9RHOB|nr:LysE family translocator [Jannaschia pohangensis]SFI99516.1 Threonine/homoserine/homoserine lactone efflux protein [Jannaschia pohangensis]